MKRRLLVLVLVVGLLSGCDGSGDRVLVGKWTYDTNIVPPSRYDVVVFKFPTMPIENGTPKNYIKRLMGLPGELIAIFFGQLYRLAVPQSGIPSGITEDEWRDLLDTSHCSPLDLWKGPEPLYKEGASPPRNYMHPVAQKLWDHKQFEILHKPPAVMLALSRPVFDNDHQPKDLDGIVPARWAAQGGIGWLPVAKGFQTQGKTKTEEWLRYRHLVRPRGWPAKDAQDRETTITNIKAGSHLPQLITDMLGYNTYEPHAVPSPNWVGDLMLTCKLTVDQPLGEFWMELSRGVDRFQARFDLGTGVCSLYRQSQHKMKTIADSGQNKPVPDWQLLATADTRIKAKGDYSLRFANYDERLTVWVDRDLPFGDGKTYPTPALPGPDETRLVDDGTNLDKIQNNDLQPASMCSVGAAVQVQSIKVWRDTYYTGFDPNSSQPIVVCDHSPTILGDDWGLPHKWEPLHKLQAKTIYIFPKHFLCLGDNSQESSDSRAWGLVPERLMLGRALMVYFPFDRAGTIK